MKPILMIISVFISTFSLFSQGYNIDINIKGIKNEKVILGHHYNDKLYPDDSIIVDNYGRAILKGNKSLPQGMYFIMLPSKKYLDFLLTDNQYFSIETDVSDLFKNAKFSNSSENQAFIDYQRSMIEKQSIITELNNKLKATKNEYEKKSLLEQIEKLGKEVKEFNLKIIKENSSNFFGIFIKATQEIDVPDAPRDVTGKITDSLFQYKFYKKHYFDNFNLSDARLLRTPIYENKILNYINKVIPQIPDSIIKEVDMLINKSRTSPELFKYMLITLFNYYAKSNLMGFDKVYYHIGKNYYLTEASWTTKEFYEKLNDKLLKTETCLIGLNAQELSGNDINGNHVSLYSIKADYTILYFWHSKPGTEQNNYNVDFSRKMNDFAKKHSNYKVIAISIEEDENKWRQYVSDNNLNQWINLHSNNVENDFKKLYDISGLCVYVLDRNKTIIGKRINVDQMESIIANYDKKYQSQNKDININNENQIKNINNAVNSDVDKIENSSIISNSYKFALIIGNESYSKFQQNPEQGIDVDYAENDAWIFSNYATNILGVPERNVFLLKNGTLGQILYNLNKINKLAKYSNGKAEIIFYYAGHGLSDPLSKEPYIVPIDADPGNFETQLKLNYVFNKLGENSCKRISAYFDASFSGGARNQPLVKSRGVKIKPKEEKVMNENMVVLFACGNEQTASAIKDKKHGAFTYSLLKVLKETKGLTTYDNLFNKIKETISVNSNNKQQLPLISTSINNKLTEWNIIDNSKVENSEDKNINVDENIPVNNKKNSNIVALIIGNEDYSTFQTNLNTEVNVDFAKNDAIVFKKYLLSTFGVEESNLILLTNATLSQMNIAIQSLQAKIKNLNGQAEVIFYYAGHGLPDEETKEPYLIPVDINSESIKDAIKVSILYKKLTEFPIKKANVFLDACFSGGARNQTLLSLRGVKIKPKNDILENKIVIFASSSGEESSSAYKTQKHGIFTYFLLKKLYETKGACTYEEMSKYLKEKISFWSVYVNNKLQTPQIMYNQSMGDVWLKAKLFNNQ